jgi:hypothetical protein
MPEEILQKKIMIAEEVFVNCYNINSITEAKKGNFKVSLKLSGARTGAGAEIKFFGSTKLLLEK